MLVSRFRDLLRIDRTDGANHWQNHGQSLVSRLLARWASRTYCDYLMFLTIMTYFTLVQGACSHYVWPSERDAYPVSISSYTVRPIRNTQQASERMCLLAAPTQGNHAQTPACLFCQNPFHHSLSNCIQPADKVKITCIGTQAKRDLAGGYANVIIKNPSILQTGQLFIQLG